MSNLGQRLKQLRKQNDLSQKDVAQHLKITVSALSQYETGKRTPKNESLLILAKLYNTTTDYLLGLSLSPTIGYNTNMLMSDTEGYYDDDSKVDPAKVEQQKFQLNAQINSMPYDKQSKVVASLSMLLSSLDLHN